MMELDSTSGDDDSDNESMESDNPAPAPATAPNPSETPGPSIADAPVPSQEPPQDPAAEDDTPRAAEMGGGDATSSADSPAVEGGGPQPNAAAEFPEDLDDLLLPDLDWDIAMVSRSRACFVFWSTLLPVLGNCQWVGSAFCFR